MVTKARRGVIAALTAVLALALAGCNNWINLLIPAAQTSQAESYISDLQQGRYDRVDRDLDPQYLNAGTHAALVKITALFPRETPRSIKVVGSNTFTMSGVTQYHLTLEYEYAHRWLIAEVWLRQQSGRMQLEGVHVAPIPASLEQTNAFTFRNRPPFEYAFLGFTIAVALFSMATTAVAFFTRIPRRKWLWRIFVMFGLGQFSLNWTTGQWGLNLLAFQLFAASWTQQFYGPAILSFGLPVGALLFWTRRGSWKDEPQPVKDTGSDLRTGG